MQTINGKLVTQEQNQLNTLKRKTEELQDQCENLELQVTGINKQIDTIYFQEMNAAKSYLQKLDKKLNGLEQTISKQAKQLLFLKICSVLGLASLWLWFGMNNQPQYHKTKPLKHAESIELIEQALDS